jgi:hypothetical protein
MQKVVFSETTVTGPQLFRGLLPQPEAFEGFYRDIAVLAFPSPTTEYRIADIAEKAFYERGPISSKPGVRAAFPRIATFDEPPAGTAIARDAIIEIASSMADYGTLAWEVPAGDWTILRVGHTSTGQTNRPAPLPGLECDKLDTAALDAHFEAFTATILRDVPPEARDALVATHLDSWEVGAQNWTSQFRQEFLKRRGYDLLPFFPVMTGRVVDSLEIAERFLWDLRQTVSDLIVENHGTHLRELANKHGLWFSVEPYDMTPVDDMTLGATGDVPMCEFWSKGFDTRYSVKEATSVAHVYGKPIVAAEAFTSVDRWLFHVVGVFETVARISRAMPTRASAGRVGRGCALPESRGRAERVPNAGTEPARLEVRRVNTRSVAHAGGRERRRHDGAERRAVPHARAA